MPPLLLCLPIRNTPIRAAARHPARPFALLTDTQRPLRIGKQSKGWWPLPPGPAVQGVAHR